MMSTFKILILAVALVFSLWPSYVNVAIVLSKEPAIRKLKHIGITSAVQFLMAGAGFYIAYKTISFYPRVNTLISLCILLVIGLKILLTEMKSQSIENTPEFMDLKTSFWQAVTYGLHVLAISVAVALLSDSLVIHWTIIGAFVFSGTVAAFVLSPEMAGNSLRYRFSTIGGILLLAVALKLTLTVVGFGL